MVTACSKRSEYSMYGAWFACNWPEFNPCHYILCPEHSPGIILKTQPLVHSDHNWVYPQKLNTHKKGAPEETQL